MAAKQAVNVGSVPSSTGTGAGSASNTGSSAPSTGVSPTAPKPPSGFDGIVQELLDGFEKYVPAGFVLPSAGGGYAQSDVVAQLTQIVDAYSAAEAAKKAAAQAVAQVRAMVPGARAYVKAVKDALVGYYGRGAPALAEFGIATKARKKPTSLQTAVAAAKAKQTRVANGTRGVKQKAQAAFAKQVQSVASTLIPAGPQPAPQAGPAPATPGVKQS